MAALSILALYTHFFGLLLAGALFTGALTVSLIKRVSIAPIALAGSAAMTAAWGLRPFVAAAFEKSGGNATPERPDLKEFVRYAYRGLFGHPALSVSTTMVLIAVAAAAFVGVVALWPKRRETQGSYAVLVALVAGMSVAALASFKFSAFDGMQPSYNLWRLPGFALLLASALAVRSQSMRRVATVGCAALIAAEAFAAVQLMSNGAYFSHGPHRQIARVIEELGPTHITVIHDGQSEWGSAYFPIRYEFHGEIPQFAASEGQGEVRQLPVGDQHVDLVGLPSDYLLVIQSREQSWSDVAEQIRHGDRMLEAGPIAAQIEQSSRWKLTQHETFVGMLAADVRIYHRQ
jgi:hypothetical protein